MGLFDFFDRFDLSNPEAQIVNSPLFNAQARRSPMPSAAPIKYGQPGSALAGNLMHRMGVKADPNPIIGGGGMQGNMPVVRPSDAGTSPLTGGKTYGPTRGEMLSKGVSDYVPEGYQGLEKSGQVWGNAGSPTVANVTAGLNSGNTLANAGYTGLGDGYAVVGKKGAANINARKAKIDKGMVINSEEME